MSKKSCCSWRSNSYKFLLLFIVSIALFFMTSFSVFAANCYDYDGTDQTTCEAADINSDGAADDCSWDSWGNYCMEKGCWDYWTQNSCDNATGCFWQLGGDMFDMGWCEDTAACWNYWEENPCTNVSGCFWKNSTCNGPPECSGYVTQTTCDNSGLGCWWDYGNYCYKPGAWDYRTKNSCENASYTWVSNAYCQESGSGGCWNYGTQDTCEAVSSCAWENTGDNEGWCYTKGCWEYDSNATCSGVSTCMWKQDEYSSWCTEKQCWNLWENSSSCVNNTKSLSCQWQASGYCENPDCSSYGVNTTCDSKVGCYWDTTGDYCTWEGCWTYYNATACNATTGCLWDSTYNYCQEYSCWSSQFSINSTTCEDDTDAYSLDCVWDTNWGNCYENWCGSYNETACNNSVSGKCYWQNSWCHEKSCWGYNTNETCSGSGCNWNGDWGYCEDAASVDCYDFNQTLCTNATNNATCRFDSWSSSCVKKGCWDFNTNASCTGANLSATCEWTEDEGGWCEESGVQCWDLYTQNTCDANNCTWDSTWSTCMEKGCWQYWDSTSCDTSADCTWQTSASAGWGWCEKRACWNYDDNETGCLADEYNLSCTWQNATDEEGWCYGPWNLNCWRYEIWYNASAGLAACENATCTWENKTGWCYEEIKSFADFGSEGECLASGWGLWNGSDCIEPTGGVSFTNVNPGCWIFDSLASNCTAVVGCSYNTTTAECSGLDIGIECGNITEKNMCGKIPMLSTCCKWKAGRCTTTYDTACWDQMANPPDGATHCMDYNAIDSPTLCNQIAAEPWYMPCKWDNTSGQCMFKDDMATDVVDIKTKKNCEFLGGIWKTESICDDMGTPNNASDDLPAVNNWCEFSAGASLYGCDVSCFACNSTTTCSASNKGYCTWVVDTAHPQGGYCDIPDSMELQGDCDKSCGSCEYYSSGDYTPQKACKESQAQCKWDNATNTCIKKKDKGCVDDCFSCTDKNICTLSGGGSQGTCKWDDVKNMCKPANFDGEICFDSIDNDQNDLIDCDDPACMFDPFCGGGDMSQCWMYFDNSTCTSNSCAWFQDSWTQMYRCGMKGESCWTHENDEANCDADANCQWFSESHCEINHTKADKCFTYNTKTTCGANTACKWESDPFSPQGGWCDFAVFECHWNSTLQQTKTKCESKSYCVWNTDSWTNEGMCEPRCFARDNTNSPTYTTQNSCNNAVAGGLCSWSMGWCEPNSSSIGGVIKGGDCAQYDDDMAQCEQQPGCAWFTDMFMGGPITDGAMMGGGGGMGPDCNVRHDVECGDFNNATACNASNRNQTPEAVGETGNACRWVDEGTWSWCTAVGEHCGPMHAPFCVGGRCYSEPQVNATTCAADTYCIVFNDTYAGGKNVCIPACMNDSLNISTCQAAGDGQSCNWMGTGGGGGACDINYCESAVCDVDCAPSCASDCESRCSGCHTGGGWGTGGGTTMGAFGGWCDPAGMMMIFQAMETGKPHEVAMDPCPENLQEWADACFLGIKEMPNDYGFGVGLESMTYAAACNDETLWDGSTGSGRKTTKGYWYLDTDNNVTNNCNSSDNAQQGFEFKFIAEWKWSNDGLTETKTAKRCLNGSWAASKIYLNAPRKKMCRELQGMMITANKASLLDLPNLFKPQYPMRIYATTANETGTDSSPTDTIGPGYYQAGAIDFKMEDCDAIGSIDNDNDGFYAYEDPDCKHLYMTQDKGFKTFEDCVTPYDDDADGLTNCDDSECADEEVCGGTLQVDSSDHTPPQIKQTSVDTFLRKAVVNYKTDERANGTLSFYYNESGCSVLNATIRDKGLFNLTADARTKYAFDHTANIDNSTPPDNLSYSLDNTTVYYYKITVCDISGNCKVSGCSNFTTRSAAKESTIKIGDPDSGESWDIDKGTGNFTTQGGACAAISNSSYGEAVNPEDVPEVDLRTMRNTSDGKNMTLEIGGISTTGGGIINDNTDVDTGTSTGPNGTTENYFWMNESSWGGDSGIHTQGTPDNMTMTFPGNDTDLWDCENEDGSGNLVNCTNITSYATRNYNETTNMTEWVIPDPSADLWSYILDSTPPPPSGDDGGDTTTTTGGGGGGGGGGAAAVPTTSKSQKWQLMFVGDTKMNIAKADLSFNSITMSVNKKLQNAEVTVKKLNSKPETVTTPLDTVYQYVEIIKSIIKDADIDKVKIEVKVEKEWIVNNSIDEDAVVVNRWSDNKWNALSTKKTASDDTYIYYDVTSPGLSYFTITAKKIVVVEVVVEEENVTNVTEEEIPITARVVEAVEEFIEEEEVKETAVNIVLVVLFPLVLIFIAVLGYVFYRQTKKPEQETKEEETKE